MCTLHVVYLWLICTGKRPLGNGGSCAYLALLHDAPAIREYAGAVEREIINHSRRSRRKRKGIWLPMCGSDLTHGRVTTLRDNDQRETILERAGPPRTPQNKHR